MLENDWYNKQPELIVEELLTFFLAGMKTIQVSTTNAFVYLEMYPEVKKKLLKEIIPVVEAAKDDIVEKLEYETVMDLDYLH